MIFAFDAAALADALGRITKDNAQGEYYVGDVLPVMRKAGLRVTAHRDPDPNASRGVNSRADLAACEREARAFINRRHMEAGVTLVDPDASWIDADVALAADVRVEPGCALHGRTVVAEGATIGPLTTLVDAAVGAGATVLRSHLVGCEVGERCTIGPFSYLRPGTWVGAGAKIGAFVEVKNSVIGPGAKVVDESSGKEQRNRRKQEDESWEGGNHQPQEPRRAPSSRSRTPRSAPAPRCRISPTSATPKSAIARTSAPARSRPTTTASTSTGRRSGKVRESPFTPHLSLRSASARTLTLAPVP